MTATQPSTTQPSTTQPATLTSGAAAGDRTRRPSRRAPRGARVFGYLLALAINTALLWVVNVTPGWRWLPVLTEDFRQVVGLVTLSLLAGVAVNLWYLVSDPVWAKQLGDALTGAVAFLVMLQLIRVFPFALGTWAGWEPALWVFLWLGCIGSAFGVVAQLASLVRSLVDDRGPTHADGR
jgi:hypothetical protein